MLTDQKTLKEQAVTFENIIVDSEQDIGNSRFGIVTIMVMACFVGAWGCLCLISGIVQSQSFQDIGRGFFTAFTGI